MQKSRSFSIHLQEIKFLVVEILKFLKRWIPQIV